jgi:hypothetical protein
MKIKNFIIAGFVGGIVDFLLGWVLWGVLFKSCFPPYDEKDMNMLFIFLACMTFSFFMAFIFTKWANIISLKEGVISGAIFGLFIQLYGNFFEHSMDLNPNYTTILIDISLTVFCGAFVGAVIALINGKLK